MSELKVLVCGSRHFNDYSLLKSVLSRFNITAIIHGAAKGADTLSGRYGEEQGIPVQVFPAMWKEHGSRAGPIRNYQMLKEGNPDQVVAYLAPNSRGTKHMIDIAIKAGIPVEIINV